MPWCVPPWVQLLWDSLSFLITSVLNCASDRLAISLLLSYIFSGALICFFIWAISFLSQCTCYVVRGGALSCFVTLYVGEGSKREQWCLLCSLPVFSHSLHYPPSNWAVWCCFPSGWVCVCSRTLWVSPTISPVKLAVYSAAASPPTGVFNKWFEAWFPGARALGCEVCYLVHQLLPCQPAAALPTPFHNPPPLWFCQLPPCCESSPPSCLSLPLLLVWMNVSSLSPGLLDLHTVRFSDSCGYVLFLICCCPSFGHVRRHSVSTYTSILAGSHSLCSYLELNISWLEHFGHAFIKFQIITSSAMCLSFAISTKKFFLKLCF